MTASDPTTEKVLTEPIGGLRYRYPELKGLLVGILLSWSDTVVLPKSKDSVGSRRETATAIPSME